MFPIRRLVLLLALLSTVAYATPPSIPPFKTSQANIDTVVNQAGSGPTNFSQGLDLTEIATPSNPSSGKVRLYSKSGDNLFTLNSAGTETQVGSGSGQKNYVQAGTSTTTGWTASGAGITVANDTTAADLPRPQTSKTAIKFTGVSGSTAFGYNAFQIDPSDYNTKLQVQFAQACGLSGAATAIANCATNDFQVQVYSCTVAWSSGTCSGTSTRIALSTDSSAVSGLPATTGTYRTTFDAPGSAAPYLQLEIGLNGTNTHAITLSDVVVGPGIVTQGAAVSQWQTCDSTVSLTNVTTSAMHCQYRRVGESIQERVTATISGAPSGVIEAGLPTGLTLNTASIPSASQNSALGTCTANDADGNFWSGVAVYVAANELGCTSNNVGNSWNATIPFTWASSDIIAFDFTVPVNEWAGAGTVNVVQNDVEYAYNTNTADADDTSSFGYGPAGQAFPTTTFTGARLKTVRFLTPISAGDIVSIEVDPDNIGRWQGLGDSGFAIFGATVVVPYTMQAATTYGIGMTYGTTATDIRVQFGQYASPNNTGGTVFAAAGNSWSSSAGKWRLKKARGGQAVGFGQATATSAGLLKWYEEGTFTPTVTGTGTAGAVTYSTQLGIFTREGRVVHFSLRVIYTNWTGSPTGVLEIGGLPYASNNTSNLYPAYSVLTDNVTLPASGLWLMGIHNPNATTIDIYAAKSGANSVALDPASNSGSATRGIFITGSYNAN